jgi:hypothetical protein
MTSVSSNKYVVLAYGGKDSKFRRIFEVIGFFNSEKEASEFISKSKNNFKNYEVCIKEMQNPNDFIDSDEEDE